MSDGADDACARSGEREQTDRALSVLRVRISRTSAYESCEAELDNLGDAIAAERARVAVGRGRGMSDGADAAERARLGRVAHRARCRHARGRPPFPPDVDREWDGMPEFFREDFRVMAEAVAAEVEAKYAPLVEAARRIAEHSASLDLHRALAALD